MNPVEQALTFDCGGERLVGVVAAPPNTAAVGVLIVVGGPQYRVGSHRQFVHLARRLAQAGIAAMRFDYRGMGDAEGAARSFEEVSEDIGAAIAAFRRTCPMLERVVLWGLCDAASATLMYVESNGQMAVDGIVLVNPWVRSDATLAKTQIKHYYARRVLNRGFWGKLLRGGVDLRGALGGVARAARLARGATPGDAVADAKRSFQERMAAGLEAFAGPVLLLMSGRDLTEREFDEHSSTDARWKGLLGRGSVERRDFAEADHTFSSAEWRDQAETATIEWIDRHIARAVA
ncbi:MAG TPA: hydrolase 1, exosortase A system-associated [Casimicrobiaceae bacterium]|nr:hydrolase 1, exosortase A system-associated [Casimicrobiaceae bacterium]